MKALLQLMVLMLFCGWAHAVPIDTYEFTSAEAQERGLQLAGELRCPQCQNQNLHDSNSPIARDMRIQVYEMVEEGKSNDQIVSYFTDRYGDFVRYRPGFDAGTYVLWLGPFALLIIGGIVAMSFIRKQRQQVSGKVEVSEAEKAKLAKLLQQDEER